MSKRCSAILAFGFSAFGLISCSPDSHQDDWQVSAPVLRSPTQANRILDLHAGFTGEISADSIFTFPMSHPNDLEKITAHARCSRGSAEASVERVFRGSSTVALAALLPEPFLFSFSQAPLACQFSFELKNNSQSTRSLSTKPVSIANFESLETETLPIQRFTATELQKTDLTYFRANAVRKNAELSVYSLICDRFENSRVRARNDTDETLIQELVSGPIALRTQPGEAVSAAQDSRFSESIQHCKFVVMNQASGRSTDIIESSEFLLSFPASRPNVSTAAATSFRANTDLNGMTLVTFRIENADPVTATYRISASELGFKADTFGMQTADQRTQGLNLWYHIPSRLNPGSHGATVQGALAFQTDAPFVTTARSIVFQVPPHGSTLVNLRVASRFDCANRNIPATNFGGERESYPACHDWFSCLAVWKLSFHLPLRIELAREVQNTIEKTNNEVRDSIALINEDTILTMTSNAEDEAISRQQTTYSESAPMFPLYKEQMRDRWQDTRFCD